jgi:hypothetical protein
MRQFLYTGDHEEVTLYGVAFCAGEPTAIDPEQHPVLIGKLEGNSHFDEVIDGQVSPEQKRRPRKPKVA